jgi:hypothetical protein
MSNLKTGWIDFLRREGARYLTWLKSSRVLNSRFDTVATALSVLLHDAIRTPEDASEVWKATPAVLSRCNDQATYAIPGADAAYAWLHLLDRYARTWSALEVMVECHCLPLARHGVRALDVGTGPGPSAFAVHDFYAAMTEFSTETGDVRWRQPPSLTCVEFDPHTNRFRHRLAEIIFQQSARETEGVLAMCHALTDFREILSTANRQRLRKALKAEEDVYFDEANGWDSSSRHTPDEANEIAQSLHRYRLIVFSNFLTTVDGAESFEPNLVDILADAQPGSVVMVLGGNGGPYPDVYGYMDGLAKAAGFEPEIEGVRVSSSDTEVGERVYEEGLKVFALLETLAPGGVDDSAEVRRVRSHFTDSRSPARSSQLWAYRKHK